MILENIHDDLSKIKLLNIAVVGDYCLDKYLYMDSKNDQQPDYDVNKSYTITETKIYPGGAGNVANNFLSLGANVMCMGLVGDDGYGYDLEKQLSLLGANTDYMIKSEDRKTNVCIRPVRVVDGKIRTLNEMISNHKLHTSKDIINKVINNLNAIINKADAIVFVEQFENESDGLFTPEIKKEISKLALKFPKKVLLADSRKYIDKYENIFLKCNQYELMNILYLKENYLDNLNTTTIKRSYLDNLFNNTHRLPLFLTCGHKGIKIIDNNSIIDTVAIKVLPPINTCGAGDSATVGIILGLCLGYDYKDSAKFGNLIASITIKELDSTGCATIDNLINYYNSAA